MVYLKNDNLVVRQATTDDVQILCDWWSDGKVMAHAGFPNGVHTDPCKLMNNIKKETDTSKILIIKEHNMFMKRLVLKRLELELIHGKISLAFCSPRLTMS